MMYMELNHYKFTIYFIILALPEWRKPTAKRLFQGLGHPRNKGRA